MKTVILAPLLLLAVAHSSPMAETQLSFRLQVTGAPNVTFAGECWLKQDDGERHLLISGAVPFSREMEGQGLRCQISNGDRGGLLIVEITRGSSVTSRSSTTARRGKIAISIQ